MHLASDGKQRLQAGLWPLKWYKYEEVAESSGRGLHVRESTERNGI